MRERIVVITGASGGLGEAVTDAFLNAGDVVFGISHKGDSRGEAKYHPIAADLTSSKAAGEVIAHAARTTGQIDVLVHVMGGFAGGTPITETTDETWTRMMHMNLDAAFYVFRAVLRHMKTGGRVIAIGSRAGVQFGAGLSAYSASKAGLHALVQTAALEVLDQGITVNALLPSTIDTPANRSWGKPEEIAKWVKPESIAAQAVWLASAAASDISGALIPVYGKA